MLPCGRWAGGQLSCNGHWGEGKARAGGRSPHHGRLAPPQPRTPTGASAAALAMAALPTPRRGSLSSLAASLTVRPERMASEGVRSAGRATAAAYHVASGAGERRGLISAPPGGRRPPTGRLRGSQRRLPASPAAPPPLAGGAGASPRLRRPLGRSVRSGAGAHGAALRQRIELRRKGDK